VIIQDYARLSKAKYCSAMKTPMSLAVEVKQRCAAVDHCHPSRSARQYKLLLDISRSGLYYQPTGVSDNDLNLDKLIDRQYMITPFYRSRKVTVWPKSERHTVNRKTCTAANVVNGSDGSTTVLGLASRDQVIKSTHIF